VLFFVSVGMLFDPSIVCASRWNSPPWCCSSWSASRSCDGDRAADRLSRGPPLSRSRRAWAQIGEFSFILAGLGLALGLLPVEGRDLILAGALLSITLNPLVFAAIEPALGWLGLSSRRAVEARELANPRFVALRTELAVVRSRIEARAAKLGWRRRSW